MPTTNPRVNVTLNPELYADVQELAASMHSSVSAAIKKLVQDALSNSEDYNMSKIADAVHERSKDSDQISVKDFRAKYLG